MGLQSYTIGKAISPFLSDWVTNKDLKWLISNGSQGNSHPVIAAVNSEQVLKVSIPTYKFDKWSMVCKDRHHKQLWSIICILKRTLSNYS